MVKTEIPGVGFTLERIEGRCDTRARKRVSLGYSVHQVLLWPERVRMIVGVQDRVLPGVRGVRGWRRGIGVRRCRKAGSRPPGTHIVTITEMHDGLVQERDHQPTVTGHCGTDNFFKNI